ncbi:hypothetical protein E4U10_001101 [Claviceps purpurea]|nr:hypothetical protein E4U10_001101 [Claviceps purpurea]
MLTGITSAFVNFHSTQNFQSAKETAFKEMAGSAQRGWGKKERSWTNLPQLKLTRFCWLLAFTAGLFVVAFHLGQTGSSRSADEIIHAETVVSEAAHMLAVRGASNETTSTPPLVSGVDGVTAPGFSVSMTASRVATEGTQVATAAAETLSDSSGESASAPVTSQASEASVTTIYNNTSTTQRTVTSTTTLTTTVTLLPVPEYTQSQSDEDACHKTVTETVLVTLYPQSDATVTAEASTITDTNTQVTQSSGLSDVTLSGSPSTQTDVQTDVSFTSGAPDATISGTPVTVTDFKTDVHVTAGIPDATISAEASTVTNVQISLSLPVTSTYTTYFTTLTITDLWDTASTLDPAMQTAESASLEIITIFPPTGSVSSSSTIVASSEVLGDVTTLPVSPTSTVTTTVTATGGTPAVETITVVVQPSPSFTPTASNSTSAAAEETNVSGTLSSTSTYSPIVISHGNRRLEPKFWTGSSGHGHVAGTVVLIAMITFLL